MIYIRQLWKSYSSPVPRYMWIVIRITLFLYVVLSKKWWLWFKKLYLTLSREGNTRDIARICEAQYTRHGSMKYEPNLELILNLVLWSMNHILNLILIMIHCVIPLWIIFDILSLLLIALYPFNLTYIRHLTQWCVLLRYYFDISTYWTIQIIV